ncbi:MAG: hypothetical protein KC680_03915 [Candidatus Peregrinibacteria bacterium]|nr:hypothetical protein [Candidatus Peregrinibacteria bacterium]MCB9807842.1 hypothetical protein [Candidatus Peribacteria bacterium]
MLIKQVTLMATLTMMALLPATALAYVEPEQVLLSRELFLPPTARDAQSRTTLQTQEAAARREREQERAFELQHPFVPEPVVEETVHGSAPELPQGNIIYAVPIQGTTGFPQLFGAAPQVGGLDSANLELARTMRLLSRVNQNQASAGLQEILHSGADNLAPTGAGSVLSATVMFGAVLYTMRRAKKLEAVVQRG